MSKPRQHGTGTFQFFERKGRKPSVRLVIRVDGRRVASPRFDTKKAAQDWVDEYRASRGANAANGSFADAATAWLGSRDAAPPKMQQYKGIIDNHLMPVFERKKLREITKDDVNRYISDKEAGKLEVRGRAPKKVGKTSIALHVSMLRSIWEYAADAGTVAGRNPASRERSSKIKKLSAPPKKPRALGTVEFAKLWEAANTEEQAHLAVLALMGLRSQESAALQWGDWNKSNLDIERARKAAGTTIGTTKSKSSVRRLKCNPKVDAALVAHHNAQEEKGISVATDALIFPNEKGEVLDAANFRRTLKELSKKAGIRTVLPHELRHTFAQNQINNGINVAILAQMLGHKDPVITLRTYISFMGNHLPVVADVETNVKKARAAAKRANRSS